VKVLRAILLLAAGAALLAPVAAAAGAPGLRLTSVNSVRFPDRAFVLTASKPLALTPANVHVSENGHAVRGISVVPATATTGRAFGVVLVLDASDSMRGAPIEGAVAAARAFGDHRAAGESIGLVTFNRSVDVVMPPTTDATMISAALRTAPSLAVGTELWDAASSAIDLLKQQRITAGSIVLLTDGRDIGSRTTAKQVAAKAAAAGVRVFAVGLRSPQFSPGPLQQIARSTHAAFSEAVSPASLAGIYRSLSEQLAREYLLRYRSEANPGQTVRVAVSVNGLPAIAASPYTTPSPPSTPAPPFHRSLLDRLVSSPASIALIGLLVAALAAFAVNSMLKPSRSSLRYRVGEFVAVAAARPARSSVTVRLLRRLLVAIERRFERTASWGRFTEELEIGEFPVRAAPLAAGTAAASAVLALLGFLSPVLVLLVFVPPLLVRTAYKDKLRKRRLAFEEQLSDNLTVLAATMRAGHGFVSGLSAVLDQAEEPSRSELRRALADEQLGVPVEEALASVARRMACPDLEQVALVAALQRQTGGNTAEVLDAVVNAIRERFQLRRLVKALTAQGRLARWVLTALPVVVAGWLSLVNPHYMSPLLHTGIGQVLLTLAIVMVVAGSFAVKRITEIDI
jgi:tight adherence protein B